MQRFWEVAPPETWLILSASSVLLMAGFVLLSHTLVRSKAYGDHFSGLTHPGRLEWTLRVGAACTLAGLALWAVDLSAPAWVTVGLVGLAGVAVALQAIALVRR